MSGQSSVSPVSNPTVQNTQSSPTIWQDHSFAATALTTFKGLSGKFSRFGKQYKILTAREAKVTRPKQATPEQQTEIDNIISELKSDNTNELKSALENNTITLEQALGIIDGALRSGIDTNKKTELLNMLLEVLFDNAASEDVKKQITEFFSYILTDETSSFPNEIKQQALTALFQDENDFSEIRDNIFGKYDDNNKMPEPLLNALKDELFEKYEGNDGNQIETNENFLEELRNCKPWAIQVYAHAIKNDADILQNFEANASNTDNYYLQTLLYGLRNGHEWAKTLIETNDTLAQQVANEIAENLGNKATRNEAISLLQNIINSSNKIPTAILNLLINAVNNQEITVSSNVQSNDTKPPAWLSEVMRGIKPDAFTKIVEQIVNPNEEQWKKLTGAGQNVPDRLDTIATLALAALPKDDSKINESCMPFAALNGLLLTNKFYGPSIVAHIGKALVDADCDNPTWTNTRTTTFLKSLNAIDSTKTQEGQEKSPSEMAKDALLLCRLQLEYNSYKFDVAIQYVADDESEQKQDDDKKESSAQNPTPITSFFVDCLSPATFKEWDLSSIIYDIQSFQNYTGEPLYQFKPQTYERIKDAMMMEHARKAYALKQYQEQAVNQNNDFSDNDNNSIKLDNIDDGSDGDVDGGQEPSTRNREVEEKMDDDFNTWYNEYKGDLATDFTAWYTNNKKAITEHLNSASDKNTESDIGGITLDRSPFQKQLQYLGRIDKSRYKTLSDEHIQSVTNNILSLANKSQLQTELMNNNPFKSNYILEKSCSQLLNYFEHGENDQTKALAETALETILKHYCCNDKRFANAKKKLDNKKNPNRIKDATNAFIAALHGHNGSIDDINEEILQAQQLQQQQLLQAKALFTEYRELKDVPGTENNCLFYAICKQKPENDNTGKYVAKELREKYVEIQTAKVQPDKTVDQKSLNNEQADISCLPQMATHLKRPIVVLVEQTTKNNYGTGIQIALPKGNAKTEILLPPISVDIITGDTTIEAWLNNYNDRGNEFNALTETLKKATGKQNLTVDNVKKMPVQKALNILLKDSNTIALYFNGNTENGHYQSFVPKKTGR